MAAEVVMLENLSTVLSRSTYDDLLDSMKELRELKISLLIIAKHSTVALKVPNFFDSNIWRLMDRVYEADDLFDKLFAFANGRSSRAGDVGGGALQRVGGKITQEVSLFFSSHNQLPFPLAMVDQVKKTSQHIDELLKLLENEFKGVSFHPREFLNPQKFNMGKSTSVGRKLEQDKIIEMLLQPIQLNTTNVFIIPIVGLPGVGKSTLAKDVYDDEKVKDHFDLKMWVRASLIFDEAAIIRKVVESCTSRRSNYNKNSMLLNIPQSHVQQNCMAFPNLLRCQSLGSSVIPPSSNTSMNEIDFYERKLYKKIEGKRYLLVLDDACLENWQRLKDLLATSEKGSRILVTTRSVEVAHISKTENVEAYQLSGLGEVDSRSLFETPGFGEEYTRGIALSIGHSIASKCKGVPLTIKFAAGLLQGKNEKYLSSFRKKYLSSFRDKMEPCKVPEQIMDLVSGLSYNELPTDVKACFGYCSLFPEDYVFNKHDLISLWTAQGFFLPQHGQSLEKTAECYFLELCRRCFFEIMKIDYLGNIVTCKMHHAIRSLACQHVSRDVNIYMEDLGINQVVDSTLKHVTFTYPGDSPRNLAPSLLQARSLRTLLSVKEPGGFTSLNTSLCNVLISNFKCLRVLGLHDLEIEDLPVSIGELIHLRYLDLSRNGMVNIPNAVTKLYYLQTLKLNSCSRLRRLPRNFGELVNLKRLEVDECGSLTGMPPGIEKLKKLEILSRFFVAKDCSKDTASVGLKALKDLNSLRGRLGIELTGNCNINDASHAELSRKTGLEELKISWTEVGSEKSSYRELLKQLRPNSELKILRIEGYRGEYFPIWALEDTLTTSLPSLVVVSIERCDECKFLPPFGKLPSLRRLTLKHMANVQYLEGETFLKSSSDNGEHDSTFFPSLEELFLHNIYKLEGWREEKRYTSRQRKAILSFPRLSKLSIWNCPNLTSMPLFMKVEDLDLRNVNHILLEKCADKAPDVISQQVGRHYIKFLQIKQCPNLKSFEAVREMVGGVTELRRLIVERCDALSSLASDLNHLTSLERLEISSCKELNLSDEGISATDNSTTMSSALRKLSPWISLNKLQKLTLRDIPKLVTLPEGLRHVQSLKLLWISRCPAFTELPKYINCLNKLQYLWIENCLGLKELPEEIKEVKSLLKVEITRCPQLMERCREYTGEDWHKIKHAQILLHKSWRYGQIRAKSLSEHI